MPNLGKIATNMNQGLNEQASQTIQQNECSVAENFMYHDRAASVREGYQVFGSLPAPVVALRKFYNKDGGNYFTAIAGGQFYNCVISGEFTSVSMAPVSGTVHTEIYGGAVYFTDYASPVKYFDGEVVDVAGVSSPVFRKQIEDFESVNQWINNTFGTLVEDRHYTHIDHGKKSIQFSASSPTTAALFQAGGVNNELLSLIDTSVYQYLNAKVITRDLSGNFHTIWSEVGTLNMQYAVSLDEGSTWTKTNLSIPYGLPIGIASDSSNNIHVASLQATNASLPTSLWYKKYHNNSGWVESSSVYSLSSALDTCRGSCGIDASNNFHVVFEKYYASGLLGINQSSVIQYINKNYSGVWTSISTFSENQRAFTPYIDIDTSNIRHIVWESTSGFTEVHYLNSLSSNIQNVAAYTGDGISKLNPSLISDTSGNRHVFYTRYGIFGSIEHLKYDRSAGWQTAVTVTSSQDKLQYWVTPVINENNQLNVFWAGFSIDSPSYTTIRYAKNLSGWSAVQNLQQSYANVKIGAINSHWPKIPATTSGICRPYRGYVITNNDYDNNYKIYDSFDLTWEGDSTQPRAHDLTHFASDVSSDLQDIIQVYTLHDVKKNISSLFVEFVGADAKKASVNICSLSSWQSCSNDAWGLTHNIPKSSFTIDGGFTWGSCNLQIQMIALSSLNVSTQVVAKCAIDNLRMIKTPPIADHSTSTAAKSNMLFFGSSATAALRNPGAAPVPTISVFAGWALNTDANPEEVYETVPNPLYQAYLDGTYTPPAPPLDSMGELQLQGLKMVADPLPSGTYYYKTTFLKESPSGMEIESTPSFQSSGFSISNDVSSWTYIQLVNIPIAPDSMGVVGRRIYRRRSDESLYRSCYTIGDNKTTNFLDTVPNVTLGKGLEDDHTPPPKAKFITKASNQLVYYANIIEQGIAYPSRVRFSLPYEPYYCPQQNSLDVSSDDGQEITGQFEFNGIIHILKDRSTFIVNNGIPKNIHTTIGCIAPHSIAVGRSEVFWLSEDGIIKYRQYQFQNVSHSASKQSIYRIQTVLNRLPKEYLSNARGTYYNGLYLLAVTDVGSITNNLVICYDVDMDVFSIFPNLNVNCWETWSGSQEGYRLFFGNNSGLICEMFTGDYDISTPIYSKIRCKDFGIPTPTELPRKAFFFMQDLDGQPKTMNVTPIYDFVAQSNYPGQYPITLTSGQNSLEKIDLIMNDAVSFFSMQFETSGRYKINQLEIYAKQEKLR